ncbi:MAG: YqaJ viral recombinase family protein [Gemmatimonadaceae bacterium]|nr:YqaJ viral recombinase family protein [Gemmatimonadaceae bacterium]
MAETRTDFLARRRKGIGGSDVAAIFNMSPYRTVEDLWLDKTGQVPVSTEKPTPDQLRGITFESIALQLYREQFGGEILVPGDKDSDPERFREPEFFRAQHPDHPWMLANCDGFEFVPVVSTHLGLPVKDGDEKIILEVKCPSLSAFSRMKREGLSEAYILQMQHYLCVFGLKAGRWIIFCADRMELLTFDVEADPLLHETLIDKEREFWTLVETMTPPPPVVEEIKNAPEIETVGTVEKRRDAAYLEAETALREATELLDTAETLKEDAKARLLEVVGSKPGIYEGARSRIYYTQQAGRRTLDKKAVGEANLIPKADAIIVAGQINNSTTPLTGAEIDEAFNSYVVDLGEYEKQGKSFTVLKSYFWGKE